MDKFKKMIADRHEYAKAWKERTGGKVIGWTEPYFPEEIAYAAGMLPEMPPGAVQTVQPEAGKAWPRDALRGPFLQRAWRR